MAEAGSKRDPDGIDSRVGRRIRERRRQLGISQVRLAATIGISYQQVQKYEQGTNQVAASRLAAIAAALDVPPGYFFVTWTKYNRDLSPWILHALPRLRLPAKQ